jgi:DNA-binding transcriptional ArsR family regulator
MVKQQERVARLDAVFGALSHPVRRDMLEAMAAGPQTVSAMAAPHGMSLAGFMKHVRTLEDAGLISCSKEGRSRSCEIVPRRLDPAAAWLSSRTTSWNDRLDALGRHLYHGDEVEPRPAASKRKGASR